MYVNYLAQWLENTNFSKIAIIATVIFSCYYQGSKIFLYVTSYIFKYLMRAAEYLDLWHVSKHI